METQDFGRAVTCVKLTQVKSMDKVARAVETSRNTLAKAQEVVDSGDEELIREMDETGKVSGVHKKLNVHFIIIIFTCYIVA